MQACVCAYPLLIPRPRLRARGVALVCVRVFAMERGVAPTNCVGRVCTNSRAWAPSSSTTRLPCASLTVNTGYVERRAGLNWHQLPAKHPPRTFHPHLLPPSPPLSVLPEALTPAVRGIRSTKPPSRKESPPLSGATILHYENIHPQLT